MFLPEDPYTDKSITSFQSFEPYARFIVLITCSLIAKADCLFTTKPGQFICIPVFIKSPIFLGSATDIKAFVTDDPFQVYEIQSAASGATQQLDVFTNADLTVAAGVTPNFVSKSELTDTQSTSTANLRIIGVSDDPDNSDLTSANCNFKVIINEHFYMTATGV